MRWLLADEKNQYVSIYKKNNDNKILDIDITGCFPTVCRFLFSEENPDFVRKIDEQTDKLQKNIFIANTLKTTNYLKILNIISKMVILGFVFDRQDSDSASLLEFEKDGCLVFSTNVSYSNSVENLDLDSQFLDFVNKNQFKFHITEFDYYIRCNNTSWFWREKDQYLRLKGIYKHVPPKIKEFYINIFAGKEINITEFFKNYKQEYFNIIRKNNLTEILEKYYFCGEDKRIINRLGKYEKFNFNTIIDPQSYIQTFIYPIWLFQQRNLAEIT